MTAREMFVISAGLSLANSHLPINADSVWYILGNRDLAMMAARAKMTDDDLNHRQLSRLATDIIRRAEKARAYSAKFSEAAAAT